MTAWIDRLRPSGIIAGRHDQFAASCRMEATDRAEVPGEEPGLADDGHIGGLGLDGRQDTPLGCGGGLGGCGTGDGEEAWGDPLAIHRALSVGWSLNYDELCD
jgi:hypothetical protein